jgi:hypothetical protein
MNASRIPWPLRIYAVLTIVHGTVVTVLNGVSGLATLLVGVMALVLVLRKVRLIWLILLAVFTIGAISFLVALEWLAFVVSMSYLVLLLWPSSRRFIGNRPRAAT